MTLTQLAMNETGYNKGYWTSETLTISKSNFIGTITPKWGYLKWDQAHVDGAGEGTMRIDILDSAGTVLLADIVQNSDDSPSAIYNSVADEVDIKIRVKIYYLTASPPVNKPQISNIRINYYNNLTEGLITNLGLKTMLLRMFQKNSGYTPILQQGINGTQSTFNKNTSVIESPITIQHSEGGPTGDLIGTDTVGSLVLGATSYDEEYTESLLERRFTTLTYNAADWSFETTSYFFYENSTTNLDVGFITASSYDYLSSGVRCDVEFVPDKMYMIKTKYKIYPVANASFIYTQDFGNVLFNRAFKEEYDSVMHPITRIVLGQESALTDTMSTLDVESYGPYDFSYTFFDVTTSKMTTRYTMDSTSGNGVFYSAFANVSNPITGETTYDPNSFVDPSNAFDGDESTYAYKNTNTTAILGMNFTQSFYLDKIRIKVKAKTKDTGNTGTLKINLMKYNGSSWTLFRTLTSSTQILNVDNEIKFDGKVLVDASWNGLGIQIVPSGTSLTVYDQLIYEIDYADDNTRRLVFASMFDLFAKTNGYIYIFTTTYITLDSSILVL